MKLDSTRCKSCDAEIVWAITTSGKKMPVDVTPSSIGNVVLALDGMNLYATVTSQDDPRPRHTSHFATCPHAATHRKERHA
jgi:hypothetical protein